MCIYVGAEHTPLCETLSPKTGPGDLSKAELYGLGELGPGASRHSYAGIGPVLSLQKAQCIARCLFLHRDHAPLTKASEFEQFGEVP
jgi:hypothetical protein